MVEEWRDIVIEKNGIIYDYTGYYQVSNYGRVRSLNYRRWGIVKIKKSRVKKDGYVIIKLHKDKTVEMFSVHRLVAFAFIENDDPLHKIEVNHIDENPQNNHVSNLEWITPDDNKNYGTRNQRIGNNSNNNGCNKIVCLETGEVFNSCHDVERKTKLSKASISRCCRGKQGTCGGYHWKFYRDYVIEINETNELLVA